MSFAMSLTNGYKYYEPSLCQSSGSNGTLLGTARIFLSPGAANTGYTSTRSTRSTRSTPHRTKQQKLKKTYSESCCADIRGQGVDPYANEQFENDSGISTRSTMKKGYRSFGSNSLGYRRPGEYDNYGARRSLPFSNGEENDVERNKTLFSHDSFDGVRRNGGCHSNETRNTDFLMNSSTDDFAYENVHEEYENAIHTLRRDKNNYANQLNSMDLEKRTAEAECRLIAMETRRDRDDLEKSKSSMNHLRLENENLVEGKTSTQKEISSLKESLEITRNCNKWLENQNIDSKQDLTFLKQDNDKMKGEVKMLMKEIHDLTRTAGAADHTHHILRNKVVDFTQDTQHLIDRVTFLETELNNRSDSLSRSKQDKQKHMQDAIKLRSEKDILKAEFEATQKIKFSLDDDLNKKNADLAESRLQTDKQINENKRICDELLAAKKVSELLSMELSSSQEKVEKLSKSTNSLENKKRRALEQHNLYETEISNINSQLAIMQKEMDEQYAKNVSEKEMNEKEINSLKDDLCVSKQLLETIKEISSADMERLNETLTKDKKIIFGQSEEIMELKQHSKHLTSIKDQRDFEINTIKEKMNQLQKNNDDMKKNTENAELEIDYLYECDEKLHLLQTEYRSLVNVKSECDSRIDVLETQKAVLSKTIEENLNEEHNITEITIQFEKTKLQLAKYTGRVNDLETEKENLISECEELIIQKKKCEKQSTEITSKFDLLQNDNNTMQDELLRSNQEIGSLQTELEDSVRKDSHDRLQEEKIKTQSNYRLLRQKFDELEETHHMMVAKNTRKTNDDSEAMMQLHEQKDKMEIQLTTVKGHLSSSRSETNRVEDQLIDIEQKVDSLENELQSKSKLADSQMKTLEDQIEQLEDSAQKAHAENLINTRTIDKLEMELKEAKKFKSVNINRSLDDASSDLLVMRNELLKLSSIIDDKDRDIEGLTDRLNASIVGRSIDMTTDGEQNKTDIEEIDANVIRIRENNEKNKEDENKLKDQLKSPKKVERPKLKKSLKASEIDEEIVQEDLKESKDDGDKLLISPVRKTSEKNFELKSPKKSAVEATTSRRSRIRTIRNKSESLRSSRDYSQYPRRSTSIDSTSTDTAASASSRSLLRSNARLLRSTDYLLTARKYAHYGTGCAIPFRQRSFRPSSEFSTSPDIKNETAITATTS